MPDSDDTGAGAGDPDLTTSDPAELTGAELVAALRDHLQATEELPIDPTTNRWLGEAQAAAADVADGDAPAAAVTKRARQVQRLLQRAGEPDHPDAARHVEVAAAVADELLARKEDR